MTPGGLDPTAEEIRPLLEAYAAAGAVQPVGRFAELLDAALGNAPDPRLAVTNLRRVFDAAINRTALCNDLIRAPRMLGLLVRILGTSTYLADIIVRDPEVFGWLAGEGMAPRADGADRLRGEIARTLTLFTRPDRVLDSLKRTSRREILRIGALDVMGESDFAAVTSDISSLADATIGGVWELSRREQRLRAGGEPPTPCVVIALGKLGGAELNYSSDIDLMVVYGEEGVHRPAGGSELTHQEYFNRLTERFVAGLSGTSAEGHLYRVDLRLRPEGKSGPLARSLRSSLLYYETRGQQWERQMLLKARPVAGAVDLGAAFLERLTPFVHPRTQFRHPSEEIARIKARIEASLEDGRNVKLSAGGIRDIEFLVQALQLVHGGRAPGVRSANTLVALDRLAAHGFLSDGERITLTTAYEFLRRVEHHLQIRQNVQTHTLPREGRSLEVLARAMGERGAEEFVGRYDRVRADVRRVFDEVMHVPAAAGDVTLAALLEGGMPEDAIVRFLGRYGFRDAPRAARSLASLLEGREAGGDPGAAAREAFRGIAAGILQDAGGSGDPDGTLANLVHLLGARHAGAVMYRQMQEPPFRRMLLTLCGSGSRIPRALVRHPLVLEELALVPDAGRRAAGSGPRSLAAAKEEGEVRVLSRYVLGTATLEEVYGELAEIADAAVRSAVAGELRSRRRRRSPVLVLALGKYGSGERTVDADLDLMFLAGGVRAGALHLAGEFAAGVVGRLSAVTDDGPGYEVDARLRPEGRSAPLVTDVRAWRGYLRTRASLWERQALTRARVVVGEDRMSDHVLREILEFVYAVPLPAGWTEEIVAMRRRTEKRSRTRDSEFLDFKLGPGGMMDAEFLAQMLLLHAGRTGASLQARPVREILAGAPGAVLSTGERNLLLDAYAFFRRVEIMMRIAIEDRSSLLPEGEKLERLAGALGVPKATDLRRETAGRMEAVRDTFLKTAERLRRTT